MKLLINTLVSIFMSNILIECDQINKRIMGGWYASIRSHPYHVRLLRKERIMNSFIGDEKLFDYCGGSIIHKNWIVSASHCLKYKNILVIVGTEETKDMNDPNKIYGVKEVFMKLKIPALVSSYDLGLLRVNRSIEFNNLVQPISMKLPPEKIWTPFGKYGIVAGFGQQYLYNQSEIEDDLNWNVKLKATYMKIANQVGCLGYFDTFCVTLYGNNIIFFGDSGSGLITYYNNTNLLVGIASMSEPRLIDPLASFVYVKAYFPQIKEKIEQFNETLGYDLPSP